MRSIFSKIFMWFWLAMALVVVAHSLAAMMVFDEGPKRMLGGQLAMYGLQAAEIHQRNGSAAANDYLALLQRETRFRAYLFDENGNQVAGREPSPTVTEMVRSVIGGNEDKFVQTTRTDFVTRQINSSDGKKFIIVSESPRPTGIRLPFWPRIWWAQVIAVILTAGVLCYLLARYLSTPVVRLRAATQQLASGDLSARVGAESRRRRDELADLGRDFDNMAERIQTLINSQQRLLHDVSHELRSPLARMKIALELARQEDGADARWALDRIELEADRLNDLIGLLITLARLDINSPAAENTTVDLKSILDEVVLDADFEARNDNRAVRLIASEPCAIVGNERLLRSAIENVIRNAVSYTAEGTQVEVALRCENHGQKPNAEITVLDQGAGVPQPALSEIFRPFYRVADARDRQSGGIGLGLSITQRAVETHGGTVAAINAPGGGLLVEIRLPIERHSGCE